MNQHKIIEGYLVGFIVGDGHLEKETNRIVLFSKDNGLAQSLKRQISKLGFSSSLFYDKNANEWKVAIRSDVLYKRLLDKYKIPAGRKAISMKRPCIHSSQVVPFIAGLIDAEGWYEFVHDKYLRLRIKMKNKDIMTYVHELIMSLGIASRLHERSDKSVVITVNKQKDVKQLLKILPLNHPKWTSLE